MSDPLLTETRHFHERVRELYRSSGYEREYPLNAFWGEGNMRDMLAILRDSASAEEAIHAVQKTWLFCVNTEDPVKERAVDWLLENQRSEGLDLFSLAPEIQESSFSRPGNNVLRGERRVNPDFLRVVSISHEIARRGLLDGPARVLELGAGCGHLARALRLLGHSRSHVILDLPETLCFSSMFLRLNFPDARVLLVTDEEQARSVAHENFDFVFVPTMFAEAIADVGFDLFVNTASMGEMKNQVIRQWMEFVQKRARPKALFTLNRYLNTILTDGTLDWRLDENECSLHYDADWEIAHWELEPSFTRCPYVDTIICRYVEIAAKSRPPLSAEEKSAHAKARVEDVAAEDWVRLAGRLPGAMTIRDNILANDLSTRGTLFKLWDAIRHEATPRNVGLLLRYLETLLRQDDREFEETFRYEEMFLELYEASAEKTDDLDFVAETIRMKRNFRAKRLPGRPNFDELPRLFEGGYYGFNIVAWRGRYYALAQQAGRIELGVVDPEHLRRLQQQGLFFVHDSPDQAKLLVAEARLGKIGALCRAG